MEFEFIILLTVSLLFVLSIAIWRAWRRWVNNSKSQDSRRNIDEIPIIFFKDSQSFASARENMPTRTQAKNSIAVDETCSICLCNFQSTDLVKELLCRHCFHASCLNNWLVINEICPLCKRRAAPWSQEVEDVLVEIRARLRPMDDRPKPEGSSATEDAEQSDPPISPRMSRSLVMLTPSGSPDIEDLDKWNYTPETPNYVPTPWSPGQCRKCSAKINMR